MLKVKWFGKAVLVAAVTLTAYSPSRANEYVQGYYRNDGTYVQPYWRSYPDGNPFNNYSFPGNVNPHTGDVAPGNPDTYLRNYYEHDSGLDNQGQDFGVPTDDNSGDD